MPLYEYVCLDCRSTFEALRAIRDADHGLACDECGGEHVSRLLSIPFVASSAEEPRSASHGCACGGACGCGGHNA